MLEKQEAAAPLAGLILGRGSPDMKLLGKLFAGFADATRASILAVLANRGEASVGELAEVVGAPQPRISAHLSCLAGCGCVKARRVGRHAYYSVADERVLKILKLGKALLASNREHVEACEITVDR